MTAASPVAVAPDARTARAAVSAMFFQQGLLVGGWALQIPLLLTRLSITEGTLGLLIVVFGLGSVVSMLLCGPVIDRQGSARLAGWAALGSSLFLPAVALAPGLWGTALAAALAGVTIGVADLAMNANAVVVERRYGRAIMSAFHGWWSLGALVGALASGAIVAAIGGPGHALLFGALALLLGLYAAPRLARDAPAADVAPTPFRVPTAPVVWLLGLTTLFAYVPEGAVIDWSAIYVQEEVGVPLWLGGIAVASLSATMTVMRFGGDRVRDRVGPFNVLVWGGVIAGVGFALGGAAGLEALDDWPWGARATLVVAGFVTAGLGLANIVPVAFAQAGNLPGVPAGVALSFVAMSGYGGILLAPSVLGWVGERTGFAPLFMALAVMPLTVALLARRITR